MDDECDGIAFAAVDGSVLGDEPAPGQVHVMRRWDPEAHGFVEHLVPMRSASDPDAFAALRQQAGVLQRWIVQRQRKADDTAQNPPNPLSIFANPLREDPKKNPKPTG